MGCACATVLCRRCGWRDSLRAVVIGAGLGGLLTAAALAREGVDVHVLERLPRVGGRFANLPYMGYTLSTGALHMVPHGATGPLGMLLRRLGVSVEMVYEEPPALLWLEDGTYIPFVDFAKRLSTVNRAKLGILSLLAMLRMPTQRSFREWFYPRVRDDYLLKVSDSFCGWSLSLGCDEVSAAEMVAVLQNIRKFGMPALIKGGCSAITDGLVDVIEEEGGRVSKGVEVREILVEDGRVVGCVSSDGTHSADVVVSNVGPVPTLSMLGCSIPKWYAEQVKRCAPSSGIKLSFASRESPLGHHAIVFTPYAKRVCGVVEVSHADPSLAPEGMHLLMSHQRILSSDIESEIGLGVEDVRRMFPHAKLKLLMAQAYGDGWPVNRCRSGLDVSPFTPFDGLYLVGDGVKGRGGIEVEGIAMGVEQVLSHIL